MTDDLEAVLALLPQLKIALRETTKQGIMHWDLPVSGEFTPPRAMELDRLVFLWCGKPVYWSQPKCMPVVLTGNDTIVFQPDELAKFAYELLETGMLT